MGGVTKERNARIVEAYKAASEAGNAVISDLAAEFGVSVQTFRNVLVKAGIKPVSNAKRGRRSFSELPSLTDTHINIGMRVLLHRTDPDYDMTVGEFATKLRMSPRTVAAMERGRHDFTLCEMQKLAAELNVPLVELMSHKEPE